MAGARTPKVKAARPKIEPAKTGPATAERAKPDRPKGARRTTPSPETLAELGPERLIGLILDETARNPAFKKLVSAALAARQGPDAVAAMVDRRLAALEGARGYIDWQKRRSFAADLDATVTVILNELRPLDPEAALDRIVRFLSGADSVLNRVDDGTGRIGGLYERATDAAVEIAAALPLEAAGRFALGLVPRIVATPDGFLGSLLRDLVARLDPGALGDLDRGLAGALGALGNDGTKAQPDWGNRFRRMLMQRVRQDIADRRGDVDAFIALEEALMPEAPDRVAIASRLVEGGRAAEALDWLRRPAPAVRTTTRAELITGFVEEPHPDRDRIEVEIRALEALGRGQEAQEMRWGRFADLLDAAMLRDYLAKLPDFEDDEALARAFAHAEAFPTRHRALAFLVGWPNLERAARLVLAHPEAWDGTRYAVLTPAADALAVSGHPKAATLLFRRLLETILDKGQSSAYAHAARYYLELDTLAEHLEPGAVAPEPDVYKAALRRKYGRKYAFWGLIDDAGL
ncbi:DUF6880 family protein [Methylobacterium dankookense]|uniref:Uncharacterized protein n=1 Tax=Methylobacterium dankookense TaxID=560405 RepID=A0A564FUC9_9HYPH|nr:DUF6880 family protein [Methylobacterium dankookense]GJD57544.1 hypothetical protein IFDJLNFL_3447 [Methylobacterium dankookense]VUF11464.1 hypothetical protein MTDSW087_01146 [Methylobacterium dankookense]